MPRLAQALAQFAREGFAPFVDEYRAADALCDAHLVSPVEAPQLLEHLRCGALVPDGRGPDDPDVLACTHRHASFIVPWDPEVESLSDGNLRP